MTCRERYFELLTDSRTKLRSFVDRFAQGSSNGSVDEAHERWIAAEDEVRDFQNWFGDEDLTLNDDFPPRGPRQSR